MYLGLTLAVGLGVVLLDGHFILKLLHGIDHWSRRRLIHLQVLALPLLSLLVLGAGILYLFEPYCLLGTPRWDHPFGGLLVLLMSSTLLGAVLLGLGRHLIMVLVMRRQRTIVDPEFEARVKRLASMLHVSQFRVQLVSSSRPLALVYGIREPTILLSTWMLQHLDDQELEAVLTHELVHLSRGDYLMNWLAMMLRDAFFYLPTSWWAYRQLSQEKELACDDLVVRLTQRPLALASALAKVWLHLTGGSQMPMAQTLLKKDEGIANRIDRLLSITCPLRSYTPTQPLSWKRHLFISPLLLVVAVNVTLAVALVVCCLR